ncbi:MAG: protein kinase [Candidatus Hydrogenedentes bacterium]|nr:protein kinase [Candidatus Hydrogenedentota bacterium]
MPIRADDTWAGGNYEIRGTLGSGGMGVVYEAWDKRLERRVALKMVHPHLLAHPGGAGRFLREARAAARIEHPNVVRVYRVEQVGAELAIEMQYIDGSPLSALLGNGPLPVAHAVEILRQVLTALAACHDQGVIHCDLKPGNLLVTQTGQIFLSDFGISRALQLSAPMSPATPTASGPLWGTPQYSPPEAWEGLPPTPQWDIYALGVLLHEALTDRPVFKGNTLPGIMHEILQGKIVPLSESRPDLSPDFAALMAALIARDPANRPVSASAALELFLKTPEFIVAPGGVPPLRGLPRKPEAARTALIKTPDRGGVTLILGNRIRQILASTLLLASLGLIIAAALYWGQPPAQPPAPEPQSTAPAAANARPAPKELVQIKPDEALFVYDDGIHGEELWTVNDSGAASLAADVLPGPESSHPRRIFVRQPTGDAFFAASTPETGEELWYCTAFEKSKFSFRLIKDILPGPLSSEPFPAAILENVVYFYAMTLQTGRELWCSNSNEKQTAMIADLAPGTGESMPMSPKILRSSSGLYVIAFADPNLGQMLCRHDFATNEIRPIMDVYEDAGWMKELGGALLFTNGDAGHGAELWAYHPDDKHVERITDIAPGPASSDPSEFAIWKDRLYFRAFTEATGRELWVTDGTAAGTQFLADLNPGPGDGDPFGFVDGGSRLYFRATDAAHGLELWSTDGTAEGTHIAADLWPGAQSGGPYNMMMGGKQLFFSGNDGVHGEELWILPEEPADAAPQLAADLWPGPNNSEPHGLCTLNPNRGVFIAYLPDRGATLHLIDWSTEQPTLSMVELPHARLLEATSRP